MNTASGKRKVSSFSPAVSAPARPMRWRPAIDTSGKDRKEADRLARDPEEVCKLVYDVMERVWARDWFDLLKKK